MRRALILALGTALCAVPALAADAPAKAPTAAKAPAAAFKAPKNAFGQPDLSGFWTNATLTPMTRSPTVGGRAAYTPEEVKKMEAAVVTEVEEGNKPTDPNAPAEAPKRDLANVRPEFAAAGGDVGGYNRGWLDPGSTVMRVHGEPRTSLITTPNGLPPARKTGAPGAGGGFRGGLGSFDNPEQRSLGERCIPSFSRNAAADVPQRLQQQLSAFTNAGRRVHRGGDGPRLPDRALNSSTAPTACAPTWATRSAGGTATPWWSRPPTFLKRRTSWARGRT